MADTAHNSEEHSVLLSGYYGAENVGDEAILDSLLYLFEHEYDEEIDATVASTAPSHTAGMHDVETVPQLKRNQILPFLGALRRSDELFIGGGGLIGEPKVVRWGVMILLARLLGKRISLVGVGVEPIDHGMNRLVLRTALNSVDTITVRDETSKKLLEEMGVAAPIYVGSDPAFVRPPTDSRPDVEAVSTEGNVVLVSVRPVEHRFVDVTGLASALDRIAEELSWHVVFVPFHNENHPTDSDRANDVAALMECPSTVIDRQISFREADELLEATDFAIGMRLHSIILAVRNLVPVVGVSYHPKCDAILEKIGQTEVIHCDDIPAAKLYSQIQDKRRSTTPMARTRTARTEQEAVEKMLETLWEMDRTSRLGRLRGILALSVILPLAIAYNIYQLQRDGEYPFR